MMTHNNPVKPSGKPADLASILAEYGHGTDHTSQDAVLVLQRADGGAANKVFTTAPDGSVTKSPAANLARYKAMQVHVPDAEAMADLLRIVGGHESLCLALGRLDGAPATGFDVVSETAMKAEGGGTAGWQTVGGQPAICRNKANMKPSSWLLIDRDFDDSQPDHLRLTDLEEWRERMISVFPALGRTSWVDLPSSSTRLLDADGATVFPSPSSHHFVQLQDPSDLPRLGAAMLAQACLGGIGFQKTWGTHARSWAVFDPTSFSQERLSFDGAPATTIEGTTIAAPAVTAWTPPDGVCGRFDSATVQTPTGADAERLLATTGLTIKSTQSGGTTTATFEDDATLAADTEVDTQAGRGTLAEMWSKMVSAGQTKLRCQTPFRQSTSQAAVLRLTRDGLPLIYDVGPHVAYRLPESEQPGLAWFKTRFEAAVMAGDKEVAGRWLNATATAVGRKEKAGEDVGADRKYLMDKSTLCMAGDTWTRALDLEERISDGRIAEDPVTGAVSTPAAASSPSVPRAGRYKGKRSAARFAADYVPFDYLLDGVLQTGRVQSLSGFTGHAKTTVALHLAIAVARGVPFGGRDTLGGSVYFLAGENPDNTRVQYLAACHAQGADPASLPIYFHEGAFDVTADLDTVLADVSGLTDLRLIVGDTHQAFFQGESDNDNVQMLEAARQWRPLTQKIPSRPTVLIPTHPSGKTADRTNLVPRGGGAFMNEIDGNLSVWNDNGIVTLSWQGKHRGPDFAPLSFEMTTQQTNALCDAKGRQLAVPVLTSVSATQMVSKAQKTAVAKMKILQVLATQQNISTRKLNEKTGVPKTSVSDYVKGMCADGQLVKLGDSVHKLTKKGRDYLDALEKSNPAPTAPFDGFDAVVED